MRHWIPHYNPNRVMIESVEYVEVAFAGTDLVKSFSLTKGAYATIVLKHLSAIQ